jgi:uncharacterized protein (TIGR03790 family)
MESSPLQSSRRLTFLVLVASLIVSAVVGQARGLTAENVLVLYNADSGEGAEIASHYAQARPGSKTLALSNVPTDEEVEWSVYLDAIRPQVVNAVQADDQISCVVTTRGLPLRIVNNKPDGGATAWNSHSSLESELTRLLTIDSREAMGDQAWYLPAPAGNPLAANSYYQQACGFESSEHDDMLLTSRLDGFCVEDVTSMIDRGNRAFVGWRELGMLLDDDPDAAGASIDRMEKLSSDVLAPRQVAHRHDPTDVFVPSYAGQLVGYIGHGRNGGAPAGYLMDEEDGLQVQVAPGAVFHTYESYNAWSFQEGGNRMGQGLVAEWIALGGSAGLGHVHEPRASATSIADEAVLVEMLLGGYTWAEAAWAATPQLSFVNTVVGDPLMRWRRVLDGDANCDGFVDVGDLGTLGYHWGSDNVGWRQGDFTGNGLIDVADLGVLASNFGMSVQGDGPAVPEPVSISLLLAIVPALVGRRGTRLSR